MAAACDFDAVPRSVTSGGKVRFFPRTSGFTIPITSYQWKFGDQYAFTTDFATSTSQLLLADADDYFAVNERVMLSTSNTLPTGLSSTVLYFVKAVTATYLTVSLTSGGAAVTFSDNGVGTHKVEHGSALATPIFTYPTVVSATGYDVYLKVTDANSNTANKTNTDFIASNAAANVGAVPKDGTWYKVSVLLYDGTNSIVVNRNPWTGSHLYLLNPKIVDSIDRIGVLSFSILDIGDSSATERSLLVEGINVAFIRERQVMYSGVVKRVTQVIQNGYDTTTRVKLWDFECDNDLARLGKLKVESSVLPASGAMLYDTPGNLLRTILTPASGERDTRGVINCVDAKIFYQLNSATTTEDVGSRYEHLMNIHGLTNYDLRTRPNFLVFDYDTFDGANIVTINAGAFTIDEFIGGYMLFVSPKNLDTTVNASGVLSFGKITGNTATTITCSTLTGAAVAPTSNGQVIIFLGYYVDFAQDLSQPSVIAAYALNNDILQYNDNDDKRKLSTKVVASGKNLQGITISVAIAGVHAYDEDTQFYEDSTFVTQKTEGMVHSNTFASVDPVTADTVFFSSVDDVNGSGSSANIVAASRAFGNCPDMPVYFTTSGTLPTPLSAATRYFVVGGSGTTFQVATTQAWGTTPITINWATEVGDTTCNVDHNWIKYNKTTQQAVWNQDLVTLSAAAYPAGTAANTPYMAGDRTQYGFSLYAVDTTPYLFNITSAGTTVYIVPLKNVVNPYTEGLAKVGLWLHGWGYVIPTGTVLILIKPYAASYTQVTTTGAGTELTLNDNTKVTRFETTAMPREGCDFSGGGYAISGKIFVNDKRLYTSGTVTMLFGEESIGVTASGTDITYGNYFTFTATDRIMATGAKHYPHDVGCLVAKTNYTEASPQTDSPYDLYGIYIDNRTVDGNITYGQLDTYATNLLLGLGNFYKKATGWGSLENLYVKRVGEYYAGLQQVSLSTPVRIADRISTTEYTGATPEEIQVVETTLICDEGRMLLNLGDFERNVFTTMQAKTAAINRPLT